MARTLKDRDKLVREFAREDAIAGRPCAHPNDWVHRVAYLDALSQ